jgi:hypothetical protein
MTMAAKSAHHDRSRKQVAMAKKRPKRQPKKLSIDVIETRALVLVDEYGTERASVSCFGGDGGKGGFTLIQINDDDGRPRLELQVDQNGNPGIRLSTPNGGSGVSISINDPHGNGLSIGDSEGNPCIMLGVPHPDSDDPRGPHPIIDVLDRHGRRGWSVFGGAYDLLEPRKSADAKNAD